jgi:hypothetical protein
MLLPILILLMQHVAPPVATADREPQLAAANGEVALVFGRGHNIMFSLSRDNGATFSKARTIAELPVLPLSRHRGPRVAFAGKTILVSAAGGTKPAAGEHAHGLPSDGNLYVWRSVDEGATWSKGRIVNDVPSSAREGLHALAADNGGHAAAVWLDLRSEGTRLYGAFSDDSGATWSKNTLIYGSPDGTICQCCHPSLLALGGGEFAVMFRNVKDGDRDMYLLHIRNGGISRPVKLGNGSWHIAACPMDGGGITRADGRTLTAWRRGESIFLASPRGSETRIGSGKDVALAAHGGKVFAVWTEHGAIQSWISGKTRLISEVGAFPSVVSLSDGGALAAWEQNGVIATRRLR